MLKIGQNWIEQFYVSTPKSKSQIQAVRYFYVAFFNFPNSLFCLLFLLYVYVLYLASPCDQTSMWPETHPKQTFLVLIQALIEIVMLL